MPANVESMFYVREVPWHGLGIRVADAPDSMTALKSAGLNWNVLSQTMYTKDGLLIPGYRANVREADNSVLGVVSNRYKIIQNEEAFAFTDNLLGEGVTYETAGSLQGGKKVWILARLPEEYRICGDEITPYLVFMNSHDGSGAVKVALTPVRVVCQNTLSLALNTARRSWSAVHMGNIQNKLKEACETLALSKRYMDVFEERIEELSTKSIAVAAAEKIIRDLIPVDKTMRESTKKNLIRQQEDMILRYHEAPDLKDLDHSAYRLLNAVSDFATHATPVRKKKNYQENLFLKVIEGHKLIDRAYQVLQEAV